MSSRYLGTPVTWVTLFLSTIAHVSAEEPQKLPLPDKETRATKSKAVEEIYHEEISTARTPDQKRALAVRLLADGIGTSDDAAGRYVLLQMACDLAAKSGDIETAFRAAEQTTEDYEVDPWLQNRLC